MFAGAREFFNSKKGRNVAIGLMLIGVAAATVSIAANWSSPAARLASEKIYVCADTGKAFTLDAAKAVNIPVESPFSGKATGYPAETCYWTKDGTLKDDPTYVLLNMYLGKNGPTFCPECGRLVIPQNPIGIPGDPAPPTQKELAAADRN